MIQNYIKIAPFLNRFESLWMPVPSNLARGAAGRRSWAGEFALAVRCEEGLFVVLRRLVAWHAGSMKTKYIKQYVI